MIAEIKCFENGYLACYERQLNHNVEAVWAMLTENEQLTRWFQELRVEELRAGGFMKFSMPGVIEQDLEISELILLSVLEFEWFGDVIRFELHPSESGCVLILKETLNAITEQTKKDLAGWHVCLDVIQALLDGNPIKRDEEWKKWYEKYAEKIEGLVSSNE